VKGPRYGPDQACVQGGPVTSCRKESFSEQSRGRITEGNLNARSSPRRGKGSSSATLGRKPFSAGTWPGNWSRGGNPGQTGEGEQSKEEEAAGGGDIAKPDSL